MDHASPSLRPLRLRALTLDPPLMAAPMAGVSHSAFRRLVADFGGYGALSTEMLSARALLHEDLARSPFTRRRSQEGAVVYQLMAASADQVQAALERLTTVSPSAVDINLGCPAPEVMKRRGGCALFADRARLEEVLGAARRSWDGPLLVKCRLGRNTPDWREQFAERLRLFEACGVDAVTVHPRFADEKLRRRARWDELAWVTAQTTLPVIGNGDIVAPDDVGRCYRRAGSVRGIMAGRAVAVRPWFFASLRGTGPRAIDYLDIWTRLFAYTCEDFPPERALGRIKEFTTYYARNFAFGHDLFRASQGSRTLEQLRERVSAFLMAGPRTVRTPSVAGV